MWPSIRKIVKSHPFRGKQAILAIPATDTFVQHVRLPIMPAEQIPDALPAELQGKLPFPTEEALIRHVLVGDTRGQSDTKQEVIVVAAQRSTIDAYLSMARHAKLDVVGVNIEPCAIVECFARLFQRAVDRERTVLFVDLGAASTQAVLARGDKLAFARNLSFGADVLDTAVAKEMDIPADQARAVRRDIIAGGNAEDDLYQLLEGPMATIADELTQCLRYYESAFRNGGVERAIFVGGGAHDKRLCQSLARRLNLPAQIGDPLMRIKHVDGARPEVGIDRRNPQPTWTVAVGLSLGATQN
jgi:type IV pilus assembly protein PilM